MKIIIRSLITTLALAVTSAFAAEPVAVWSGFGSTTSGTYTANLGNNTVDATTGAVTLGSNGIRFTSSGDAWSGETKGWTVAIKYSDFKSGTAAALVSLQQNSETSAAGIDKIGAWVNANGKVQGLWQAGAYGTANGTLPASGVVFVRYNDTNGTSVHLQSGTLLYSEGGLKSSDNNWGKSFAVGSKANGTSNVASGMTIEAVAIFDSRVSDQDMAAYEFPEPEVAPETLTYDGFLTTTFVDTGWQFDLTKLDECEITGMMSGSSIANRPAASTGYWMEPAASASGVAKFQMQVYQYNASDDHWLKAVEVELKKGDNGNVWMRAVRTGYVDGGLTDPKGSIKITNWNGQLATSENAGGYGVNKVVIKVPTAQEDKPTGKVINFNFRNGSAANSDGAIDNKGVQTTLLGDMPEASWNQNTNLKGNKTGYNIWNFNSSTSEVDSNLKISWADYYTTYNNCGYTEETPAIGVPDSCAYLRAFEAYRNPGTKDDSNVEYANFKVENIPFAKYEVIVYCNGNRRDGSKDVFNCVNVNGTDYTVDENGELVAGTDTWGATRQTSAAFGTNAFVFRNGTASTFEVKMKQTYANLAAFQIVEKDSGKKKVEVDCGAEYLMSEANAVEGDEISLKFANAGGTLLVDEAPSRKYTIKCAGAMKILGDDYTMTQGDFDKLTLTQVSGGLTIDARGGLVMGDAIKNTIKAATNKTYTFLGTSNKGATINYGTSVNATLNSHIVFNGGTHVFTFGQSVETKDFGANASHENPTVWVKGGATLNFTGKDLTGWNGTANANGVIRVDNGATLNFLADGRNTIYYRQRLCLEPGAKVTFPDTTGANDNKPVVRFLGGTAENNEVIYVLPPTGNATTATISGNIFFAKDNTHGFGVFVDSNSRLKWAGNMLVFDNNDDKAIVKRGAGVFEYSGTMDGVVQVAAGAIGGNGSLRKLTLGANGALDLNVGAPTITDTFTAPSKVLKLIIDKPTHRMDVITLPASADKTGWTARVNGREVENELEVEGNTLKLKWRVPPTVAEIDADADIKVTPSADYTKSTIAVNVKYTARGDYGEDEMGYRIVIGEKTFAGVASGEDNAKTVTFEIGELEGGKIYRGEFQVVYGEDGETAATAPIAIRQGKLVYVEKDPWVNETPETLKETGSYDPESGVEIVGEIIQINSNKDVTFTPTPDPDYADKCDSTFTISVMADEAIDDEDSSIDEGSQAGVKIVADGKGGAKFQFIVGEEWVDGPAAMLNTLYDVTLTFHYAKGDGDENDEDTVTYAVGEWVRSYSRRAGTANKVTEIIFTDGCQFAKLIGTCEIESADPVAQGIKPGEETEIVADNAKDAQDQAEKIPVLIPDDELVVAALDTDAKKADYKALFKVVAVKKGDKFVAEVAFATEAEKKVKEDEQGIVSAVVEALGSLFGGEGELGELNGQPGLYYGIATDGELVAMGEAQPTDWKIANKDGKIVGLKVKKVGKQGFYKVICTPVKATK